MIYHDLGNTIEDFEVACSAHTANTTCPLHRKANQALPVPLADHVPPCASQIMFPALQCVARSFQQSQLAMQRFLRPEVYEKISCKQIQ